MRPFKTALIGTAAFLATSSTAFAGEGGIELPEPGSLSLLAIAFAGVLIGRRLAAKKSPRD